MSYFVDSKINIEQMKEAGRKSCDVLGVENGCIDGCKAGFTFVYDTEYGKGGIHQDQEGFLVVEGTGMALIGDEEQKLYPGVCMIAPAGVKHIFKKDLDCEHVKLFWFHAAVL